MKAKGGKQLDSKNAVKATFLSLIPQPSSFGKVSGRSVAYWECRKNATEIFWPHARLRNLIRLGI